jgi:hypothetical protein
MLIFLFFVLPYYMSLHSVFRVVMAVTISAYGSVFVPECDNRIQVEIPPKAVNEDVELTLKV